MILSITRLKLKGIRHLAPFLKSSGPAIEQALLDTSCLAGATYFGPGLAAWTATLWKDEASMLHYVRSGAHRLSMGLLPKICNEAATNHLTVASLNLPSEAELPKLLGPAPHLMRLPHPSVAHSHGQVPRRAPWVRRYFKGKPSKSLVAH